MIVLEVLVICLFFEKKAFGLLEPKLALWDGGGGGGGGAEVGETG